MNLFYQLLERKIGRVASLSISKEFGWQPHVQDNVLTAQARIAEKVSHIFGVEAIVCPLDVCVLVQFYT